jgi:hypothetical protein
VFFDQNAPVLTGTTLNTITLGAGTGDKQSGKLSIHPNPATERIYIDCSSTGSLAVYDITGKDVFVRQDYTGVIELNVQSLPAGLYLVVMTDKDGVRFSGKFVKSH